MMQELCGTGCTAGCLWSWKKTGEMGDDSTDCRCGDTCKAEEVVQEVVKDDSCEYTFGPACMMQELCGTDCHAGCLWSWKTSGEMGDDSTDCRCGDYCENPHFIQ